MGAVTVDPRLDPAAARREVMRRLGHVFGEPELLVTALTHRSYRNEHPELETGDNERLEFLGDALLGFTVAALLFEAYPDAREGELTRRRADLVCEAGLAEIAEELRLADALQLGKGEDRSGGREKPRLLSSAVEAVLGAVHVDAGHEVAFEVVRRLFGARVKELTPRRDPKSALQEHVQAQGGETPRYQLLRTEGPDHERRFFVSLEIDGEVVAEGEGRSKSAAERAAARKALAERA